MEILLNIINKFISFEIIDAEKLYTQIWIEGKYGYG